MTPVGVIALTQGRSPWIFCRSGPEVINGGNLKVQTRNDTKIEKGLGYERRQTLGSNLTGCNLAKGILAHNRTRKRK